MSFYWNNLIRAYATSNAGVQKEALRIFLAIQHAGHLPNEHTFPFLFKACASFLGLTEGMQLHGAVVKRGLDRNVYVQNTMMNFYGCCKKIISACKVFDEMCSRTVVSWNIIISACVEISWSDHSIELFSRMLNDGFLPNETTIVILLSACAGNGNLGFGKRIHSQVILKGMALNCQLGTALVDMYIKCGAIKYARLVFDSMTERNVWTWSTMILGLALHGQAIQALELFMTMKNFHVRPNHVTFLGVLCACSHTGLVEDAHRLFTDIDRVYAIKPTMAHYGAMVDMLCRAGHLKEAYDFISCMPFDADAVIWRALLGACHIHDLNDCTGLGAKVRDRLLDLEPRRTGNLVMVANKYAEVGMWEKAAGLRSIIRDRGLKMRGGESIIELGGSHFRFFSGNDFQVYCGEIFSLLNVIDLHMNN